MSTPNTIARPFNALSGEELKRIIMNEIQRQLDADYRFKNHLTYPQISWAWDLHVKAYPSDIPEFRIHLEKTIRAPKTEQMDAPPPPREDAPVVEFDLGTSRLVAAPTGETTDSARRDAGLPVPAPRVVAGPAGSKVLVDAPDIPIPGNEPEKPASVQPSSAARVVARAREAAKSVSARTRANPKGVLVDLPDGASPPDEARLQQIDEKENAKPPED